jgi:predicted  nucleic acid-binding Zn-ribbon protein
MPHQCTDCGHVFPDGSKEMLGGCPDCGGNKFQFHKGEIPGDAPSESPPSSPGERSNVASAVGKAANTLRDFVGGSSRPELDRDARPDDRGGGDGVETEQATLDAVTADVGGDAAAGDAAESAGDGRTRLSSDYEWPETARPPEYDDEEGDDDPAETDAEPSGVGTEPVDAEPADAEPAGVESDAAGAAGAEAEPSPGSDDAETVEGAASGEDRAQADARSAVVDDDLPTAADDAQVASEPAGERPDLAALREELNDQFESIKVLAPGQYELNLMELYDREEYIIAIQENGKYVIEVPDAWDE